MGPVKAAQAVPSNSGADHPSDVVGGVSLSSRMSSTLKRILTRRNLWMVWIPSSNTSLFDAVIRHYEMRGWVLPLIGDGSVRPERCLMGEVQREARYGIIC